MIASRVNQAEENNRRPSRLFAAGLSPITR